MSPPNHALRPAAHPRAPARWALALRLGSYALGVALANFAPCRGTAYAAVTADANTAAPSAPFRAPYLPSSDTEVLQDVPVELVHRVQHRIDK